MSTSAGEFWGRKMGRCIGGTRARTWPPRCTKRNARNLSAISGRRGGGPAPPTHDNRRRCMQASITNTLPTGSDRLPRTVPTMAPNRRNRAKSSGPQPAPARGPGNFTRPPPVAPNHPLPIRTLRRSPPPPTPHPRRRSQLRIGHRVPTGGKTLRNHGLGSYTRSSRQTAPFAYHLPRRPHRISPRASRHAYMQPPRRRGPRGPCPPRQVEPRPPPPICQTGTRNGPFRAVPLGAAAIPRWREGPLAPGGGSRDTPGPGGATGTVPRWRGCQVAGENSGPFRRA